MTFAPVWINQVSRNELVKRNLKTQLLSIEIQFRPITCCYENHTITSLMKFNSSIQHDTQYQIITDYNDNWETSSANLLFLDKVQLSVVELSDRQSNSTQSRAFSTQLLDWFQSTISFGYLTGKSESLENIHEINYLAYLAHRVSRPWTPTERLFCGVLSAAG